MNCQILRPKMLQMKVEPNWAIGFNLILKETMFETVGRPVSSHIAFDSGELKKNRENL